MSDLATWLRAQLDEDEAFAREADGDVEVEWIGDDAREHDLDAAGTHIVRWLPSRVLAEVEAKRRILDERWGGPDHEDMWRSVVRLLAVPYADRPGYREEWRP